jgi:hypothetical protein
MILASGAAFGVSPYVQQADLALAGDPRAPGLVLKVQVRFERWLAATPVDASVFIDAGADQSVLSSRWLDDVANGARVPPVIVGKDEIDEEVSFLFGSHALTMPRRSIVVMQQPPLNSYNATWASRLGARLDEMPGYEDAIIGRDVLTLHKLVLLVDGGARDFSLIWPNDDANQDRRRRARRAFSAPR